MDKEDFYHTLSAACAKAGWKSDRWASDVAEDLSIVIDDELKPVNATVNGSAVSVVLECDFELLMEDGCSHPFFSLINKFDSVSFSKAREDILRITLTVNDAKVK